MHSAFVKINGVPTKVTCWGKWIEESFTSEDSKDILLMITGNPGITTYYHKFLETIHQRTGFHVWTLSHAGHEYPEEPTTLILPPLEENVGLYNLNGQTNHKIEFIKQYVPKDCRLHMVGHSIGAYICCQVLKEPQLNALVDKAYLLFPTIEEMAVTPNGRFYINVVQRIQFLLIFLAHFFSYFPTFLQTALVQFALYLHGTNGAFHQATMTFVQPKVVRNIMFMADDEMTSVKIRDDAVAMHKEKIFAYYGQSDGWAPVSYCEKLRREVVGIKAEVTKEAFQHAYVLKHSKEMAMVVSDWLLTRTQ